MEVPYDLIHRWLNNEADDHACQLLEQWLLEDPRHATILLEQTFDDAALKQQFIQLDVEGVMLSLLEQPDMTSNSKDLDATIMREILAEALQRRSEREAADALLALQDSNPQDAGTAPGQRDRRPATTKDQSSTGLVFDFAGLQVFRGQATGRQTRRRWLWAAGLLLAGVLAYLFLGTPPARTPQNAPSQAQRTPAVQPDAPVQVATLGSSHAAAWTGGQPLKPGDRLVAGQALSLSEGLLELQMDRGAVVILEAPFEIELIDDNRLRLDQGKLVANVPLSATRFTVDTQTAQIIDLGTDFGVQVEPDGRTQTAVFTGRVELYELASADAVPRARRSIILGAGWTAAVTPDTGLSEQATAFDTTRQAQFARSLSPDDLAALAYRRTLLATRPVAYWPLENPTQRLYDEWVQSPASFALRPHGSVTTAPGRFGQAAQFAAVEDDPQYITLASAGDIPALNRREAYSISLWFFTDTAHMGTLLSFIVPQDDPATPNSHHAQIALIETESGPLLRAFHRNPPGPAPTGHELYTHEPYPLGQWTHVALCVDPQSARLYINGQLARQAPSPQPLHGNVALRIGTIGELEASTFQRRQFDGLLDEIALYDRALNELEIMQLATPPQD